MPGVSFATRQLTVPKAVRGAAATTQLSCGPCGIKSVFFVSFVSFVVNERHDVALRNNRGVGTVTCSVTVSASDT
jgi:hypothetical protein